MGYHIKIIEFTNMGTILYLLINFLFVPDCTTVKSGNYNDPTVWNCGVVPDSTKNIKLMHVVNITANQSAKNIENQGNLNFTGNYNFYIKGGI